MVHSAALQDDNSVRRNDPLPVTNAALTAQVLFSLGHINAASEGGRSSSGRDPERSRQLVMGWNDNPKEW
jgi:hypothetical protein